MINIKIKQGFTLIEVMIVVGIVAILATIAIPNYQNYVVRSNRAQALAVLQANMLSIEQFKTRNLSYPTASQISTGTVAGYLDKTNANTTGVGYDIAYSVGTDFVTLTMTPNALLAPTETLCATITLNSNEVQTAKSSTNADTSTECWANNR
jgi:type IV pilus assembly protein PilE